MPLHFESNVGSAIDRNSGLTIYPPRIVPASPPEDPNHDEYQYGLYRNGERIDGLAVFVTDESIERAGDRERIFTLDLGRDWVLDSILSLKKSLHSDDDDFDFLQGLAKGLLLVYQTRPKLTYKVRYIAITSKSMLDKHGIAPSRTNTSIDLSKFDDQILLSELFISARAETNTHHDQFCFR